MANYETVRCDFEQEAKSGDWEWRHEKSFYLTTRYCNTTSIVYFMNQFGWGRLWQSGVSFDTALSSGVPFLFCEVMGRRFLKLKFGWAKEEWQ